MEYKLKLALKNTKEKDFLKGSSNIFLLVVDRISRKISAYYYCDRKSELEFREYDKLLRIEYDNLHGVISSSLAISEFFPTNAIVEPIQRGKLMSFELS